MNKLTASAVMTGPVLAAEGEWSLDELRTFLIEHSISGAPVTDGTGKLVGVVSTTDLMRAATEGSRSDVRHSFYALGLDRELAREELRHLDVQTESSVTVREIMTPMVFEVAPDDSVRDVADMMTRGRIHRVFVTRKGKIDGVVSALDLVRVLRDVLEE